MRWLDNGDVWVVRIGNNLFGEFGYDGVGYVYPEVIGVTEEFFYTMKLHYANIEEAQEDLASLYREYGTGR